MYRSAALIPILLLARGMQAQLPLSTPSKPPSSTTAAEKDPFDRDTPHGCVMGFLKTVARGDYAQAARYLDTRGTPSQAQELARQLQVVLNHGLTGNIDDLSRAPAGDLKDSLRKNRDLVGFLTTKSGRLDILVDRIQPQTGPPVWLFSSETLSNVPRVFEEINTPGIERFVPRLLRNIKVFSLPLWRWLAIFLNVILAFVLASLATRALIPVLRSPVRRITGQEDDGYLLRLQWPMRLIFLALAVRGLAEIALSVLARAFWTDASHVLAIAGVAWLLIEFSNVLSELRARQLQRRHTMSQIAVLTLAHRMFKIFVIFLAVVVLLNGAGVNVSAMLAGLGIGGIALALAAQKTLEDLFGGIAIITRKAVRVGDFCQLADKLGTIEEIGLGSIRLRTLDDTVVTLPNGKVSQMNLENYSMRGKIWFHHFFGLGYDTSSEQVRSVVTQITQMLRNDRRVERESARIRLIEFGSSYLKFEIFAYVLTTDYTAFVEVQEELLLRIMEILAANGAVVAVPTQITYNRDGTYGNGLGAGIPYQSEQVQHES